ncbi:FadR/GntR family transcriptional regulator [Roseitranquillus sediminis]|uniref:FadR/GntR family transcriptional regulator n=1 Tax=Roseitranquillus sediminis TaxID=2809051 RepID=UPI001D0C12A2|nr:FadR/GntR family transcriptional regulator [Roseitranquillus sediminis]MBM9596021.1 FadR family transcriptional regulator [Roseitranquillus sediminis]
MTIGEQETREERKTRSAGTAMHLAELPRLSLDSRVRSAHALITREIAIRVMKGVYPPDGILPNESQLIEEFGVSRTVLREALKTLAAKGMIVAKTKIGTKVLPEACWNMYDPQVLSWHIDAGMDSEFLIKVFEVRQALEPAAAAMAAIRRTNENLRRMRLFLMAMARPAHTRDSYGEWDLHFHQEILFASGNPFMLSFSSIIEASIFRAFKVSAPVDSGERLAASIARHHAVLEAVTRGDAAAASAAMSQVIVEGIENAHFQLATSPTTITLPLRIGAVKPH